MRRFDWDDGCMTEMSDGDYVLHDDHAALVATLIRERDEARAALDMAYPRALQAAKHTIDAWLNDPHDTSSISTLIVRILALTPEDIERIAQEHGE